MTEIDSGIIIVPADDIVDEIDRLLCEHDLALRPLR
jgi:hypothetical protein